MIVVPQSFMDMPRWRSGGAEAAWLKNLPALVADQCAKWHLSIDGAALHGSNALIVLVRRGDEPAALRLAPPGDDVAAETAALKHWDGRGVVRLLDVDLESRASLLERLDHTRSLLHEPIREAAEILGGITRTLAVPAPQNVESTRHIAAKAPELFTRQWHNLGEPVPHRLLDAAIAEAETLAAHESGALSVDGDLHFGQVLAGGHAPWTVVDPVLLRGDPEYDIGRVLWTRLDELANDREIGQVFNIFVDAAEVPSDRARSWAIVRSTSYLLWGLQHGLTLDPPKCRRLLEYFCGPQLH
jgi:streptomycin 6-kinase